MANQATDEEKKITPSSIPEDDEFYLLRLTFANEDGAFMYSEAIVNHLVAVSVLKRAGHKERFLGHIQLESYPMFKSEKKLGPKKSKVELGKDYIIAYIETSEMISARILLENVPQLSRSDAAKALAQLASEGRLVRIGLGVYAHPERSKFTNDDIEQHRGKKGRSRAP